MEPKSPAKLAWPVWNQQDFSSFKVIFFSFNTVLSFLLSCSIPSFFHFISLLLSFFLSFFFFLIPTTETIKPGTVKRPKLDPKRGHPNTWDSETNFTLLLQRSWKLLYICIVMFFIILTLHILLVFLYFSSFCLVFFAWLVNLHCLTGFPLFSLS